MNNNALIISGAVGSVVLVTALLAANEYNKKVDGPTRISGNWFASADPRWRESRYRWTDSETNRRTRVRNQLDPNNDYEAILHRPSKGWGGGRKTRRK